MVDELLLLIKDNKCTSVLQKLESSAPIATVHQGDWEGQLLAGMPHPL